MFALILTLSHSNKRSLLHHNIVLLLSLLLIMTQFELQLYIAMEFNDARISNALHG